MANYELGQVGLNPRGVYNSTTEYKKLDCVSYEGSSYIALVDNTGVPVGRLVLNVILSLTVPS